MPDTSKPIHYRYAFDIGGTFTDCVLLGSDGSIYTTKILSDYHNVAGPILSGLQQLLTQHRIEIAQVNEVVVGATTAVTNLIIERKGAPTGLISTKGFRDVIEIGREIRYDLYDLTAPGPDPIVPRNLRVEVDERMTATGSVVRELTVSDVEQAVRQLMSSGAQAIAVCLLHSYNNSSHEQLVKQVAQRLAPNIPISLSYEVLGELREYERTVATVLNAYVMPMVGDYLSLIESGLRNFGVHATLQIMQSNGGVIPREIGERMPIRMLESGPAAGALGAAYSAQTLNLPDVLAFDMGGTTAKACLISDGKPSVTTEFEAARLKRFKKGSGLPVRLPTIDLIEIGAGGGSIAHIDSTGLLKIGPHSAGSSPGPACYGLGGSLPTVTDAALVLGYLDPDGSLSGSVKLRLDLAQAAIEQSVAKPLGLSIVEAANGIHRIVCEYMATAVKIHAVEKGKDVRKYTLLAFGGAGPIHGREVARRAGCSRFLIPANAGVFSAFGLLVAPMKVDAVRTRFARLESIDWFSIRSLLHEMQGRLGDQLQSTGVDREAIRFRLSADMRYVGQGFEVETELPDSLEMLEQDDIEARFNKAYAQLFGTHLTHQKIEILNWRVEGFAASAKLPNLISSNTYAQPKTPIKYRKAYFPDSNAFLDTQVLKINSLIPGELHEGPALIEQAGSTVVIGPGDRYGLDQFGNLLVTLCKI